MARLGPSTAVTTMARTMAGKAKTMSTVRMITLSTQPPKNPEIAPSRLPMVTASATSATASGSDTRAA